MITKTVRYYWYNNHKDWQITGVDIYDINHRAKALRVRLKAHYFKIL